MISRTLSVVQSRLLVSWFHDKELTMALGAALATSRLASVLNFAVSATLARKFGVMWALWAGRQSIVLYCIELYRIYTFI